LVQEVERERKRGVSEWVCEREKERSEWVCVCVRERERESEWVRQSERERISEQVRQSERESKWASKTEREINNEGKKQIFPSRDRIKVSQPIALKTRKNVSVIISAPWLKK